MKLFILGKYIHERDFLGGASGLIDPTADRLSIVLRMDGAPIRGTVFL
jgi:hypothetical protein